MQVVIDIDERLYEIIANPETLLPTMYHASRCADAVRNGTPLESKQTDPVIKGLYCIKNDSDDICKKAYFIVNDKEYSLDELLKELENHTEVGQKFRDDIYGMILAYLMKFRGE